MKEELTAGMNKQSINKGIEENGTAAGSGQEGDGTRMSLLRLFRTLTGWLGLVETPRDAQRHSARLGFRDASYYNPIIYFNNFIASYSAHFHICSDEPRSGWFVMKRIGVSVLRNQAEIVRILSAFY